MELQVDLTLEFCVDELCTDIDIVQTIPIPLCNQDFSSYTFSGKFVFSSLKSQFTK